MPSEDTKRRGERRKKKEKRKKYQQSLGHTRYNRNTLVSQWGKRKNEKKDRQVKMEKGKRCIIYMDNLYSVSDLH